MERPVMTPMSAPSAAPAPNEEIITHSTAATRPRQRTSMTVTRASAISAQQRIKTPPASRRSSSRSSRSRSAVSAMWKRYAESPVSTTSVARSTATVSCKSLSNALSAPVAPITAAATAGINHARCAIAVSRKRNAVVNTSTSAAIYRSAHASEPETRYPAAAPRTHASPPSPPPERAAIATPNGAHEPNTRTQPVTKPNAKCVPSETALIAAGRLMRSVSPFHGFRSSTVLSPNDIHLPPTEYETSIACRGSKGGRSALSYWGFSTSEMTGNNPRREKKKTRREAGLSMSGIVQLPVLSSCRWRAKFCMPSVMESSRLSMRPAP